jgi:hypothetical protein
MNKIVSLVLLAGGVVLIVIGINATNSFSSGVSRFFTGSPTDKAVWMLIERSGCSLGAFSLPSLAWRGRCAARKQVNQFAAGRVQMAGAE